MTAADAYIGEQVTIEGWYRRGLRPFVEMWKLTDSEGRTHQAWSRWVQIGLELAAVAFGVWWWMQVR